MADRTISLEVKDHIAHVVLDRGKALNTMVLAFWQDMVDVFKQLDDMPEARVVVLSSTGKHFTAGLDLNAFASFAGDMMQGDPGRAREQLRRTVLEMQETFNVIDNCRLPVLAAVQGGCIGGGVDLISACDMRYCTQDAWFCIQEINIGMTADVGTLQRLPHIIPSGMMRELAYTGRRLKADRAREIGLVNAVYADQQAMLDDVMAIAGEGNAQLHPRSFGAGRARLYRGLAVGHVPVGRPDGNRAGQGTEAGTEVRRPVAGPQDRQEIACRPIRPGCR